MVGALLIPTRAVNAADPYQAVSDLGRLAGYAEGPVRAEGPGLDVAAGPLGAKALGERGCDPQSMTYREIVHPRVNLSIASQGAKRIDLIIRSVNQAREVSVTLDGEVLGTATMDGTWQRLSFRTQPLSKGAHVLSFTMSPTGQTLEGNSPKGVLAHLHSIRLSTRLEPPAGGVVETFNGVDTLWLEAGEALRIPMPAIPGHALKSAGTMVRGSHAALRAHVAFETREGAIDTKLSIPAALTLPWNLALASAGDRSAKFLRLEVQGDDTGALGLVRPQLTRPSKPTEPAMSAAERLVLVIVPGLRSEDLATQKSPPWSRADIWSSADSSGAALASLLTGRYPKGHGLIKRGDTINAKLETLATTFKGAGRLTLLRAGHSPHAQNKALWAGYDDSLFASDADFTHTAEGVLKALASALKSAPQTPLFATALLGDLMPPYLPRADAWRAHWPEPKAALWDPLKGRKELQRLRSSSKEPSEKENAYWRALRRGKVDETMAALDAFAESLGTSPGTRVLVVGLAGESLAPLQTLPPIGLIQAPLLLMGDQVAHLPKGPSDLSDVHATLSALGGITKSDTPGARFDIHEAALWSDLAYASVGDRWEYAIGPERILVRDRQGGAHHHFSRNANAEGVTWTRLTQAGGEESPSDILMKHRLQARECAGDSWTRSIYSIAHINERTSPLGGLCGQ